MKLVMKVLNVLVTATLLAVIAGAATLALTARRSPDRIPTVAGRKVLTVLSGSMEPSIHTGDVILVQPLRPGETVADRDIITFHVAEQPDMLITHRVVGVLKVNGKDSAYMTKGDANDSQDLQAVAPNQVLGRYQWRAPYFGYVAHFVRQPLGIVLLVILPGVLLIGSEVRKLYLLLAAADRAKAKAVKVQGGDGSRH